MQSNDVYNKLYQAKIYLYTKLLDSTLINITNQRPLAQKASHIKLHFITDIAQNDFNLDFIFLSLHTKLLIIQFIRKLSTCATIQISNYED